MPKVAVEREVKLAAEAGMALPDLTGVLPDVTSVSLPSQRLVATFFDTADLRLARWGVTLRHRTGEGGDTPWTLKLPGSAGAPAGGLARTEVTFPGPPGAVPAAAAHLVAGLTRGAPLLPVARLRTDRLRMELRTADGAVPAEVVDDEVSVLEGRRVMSRFREIEVELTGEGGARLLEAVVARLRSAGAGAPDPTPKLVRALGPRAAAPPDIEVVAPDRKATVADAVRAAIASSAARLIRHDPGVRVGDDPENVHQARVATRRMRSDLRTFAPLLDPAWAMPIRDELGWIAALLGDVRDTDVLRDRLRRHAAGLPAADEKGSEALLRRLDDHRDAATQALLAAMDSPRYTQLLDAVVAASANPVFAPAPGAHDGPQPRRRTAAPSAPAADVLPGLVRRPWGALRRAVAELGPTPSEEALHGVRIRAKRCRYAAEAAAPVIGRPAARLGAAAAELQGVLGDLHDAVVAETWLREAAAGAPAHVALTAGELIAEQRRDAAEGRRAWKPAWKAVSAKKLRRWLHDRG